MLCGRSLGVFCYIVPAYQRVTGVHHSDAHSPEGDAAALAAALFGPFLFTLARWPLAGRAGLSLSFVGLTARRKRGSLAEAMLQTSGHALQHMPGIDGKM
jgi:sugar (pentulose or hexulose) kinase